MHRNSMDLTMKQLRMGKEEDAAQKEKGKREYQSNEVCGHDFLDTRHMHGENNN